MIARTELARETRPPLMQIRISETLSVDDVDFETGSPEETRRLDDTWVSLLLPSTWPHLVRDTRDRDCAH